MTYRKPSITELGSATSSIQGVPTGQKNGAVNIDSPRSTTVNAYEVDE